MAYQTNVLLAEDYLRIAKLAGRGPQTKTRAEVIARFPVIIEEYYRLHGSLAGLEIPGLEPRNPDEPRRIELLEKMLEGGITAGVNTAMEHKVRRDLIERVQPARGWVGHNESVDWNGTWDNIVRAYEDVK